MSGRPDDFDREDDRDDPDRDERERGREDRDETVVAKARAATGAPALFLILNGLFGLVLCAVLSVPMIFQPEMPIKFARDWVNQQPPGQQRQDLEKQLDDAEKQMQQNRAAAQIQNAVELGIAAVANLLAVLGGFAMRSLGSYGLGVTGTIASIIPCLTGCCCSGVPFGIWALVVLMRPEVKAGFAAKRRMSSSPDSY